MEWANCALLYDNAPYAKRENQLFQITARLCTLRATVHSPGAEAMEDVAIFTIAKDLDKDLADFANTLPDWLGYATKPCRVSENVLSDYYHVYSNTWVVGAYNLYRSARIMTHEVIIRWLLCNPTYEHFNVQWRESELLLARLSADICASVPFILGDVEVPGGIPSLPKAAGGVALVWPLYLAATMDTASESTRAWVVTRFEKLGHLMGVQQAISLSHVLKSGKIITAWDRFESTRIDEELVEW